MRWSRSENDWLADWGPGPGRLKGPAGGLLRLVIGGGSDKDAEEFDCELRRMGFDPTTLHVRVDCASEDSG